MHPPEVVYLEHDGKVLLVNAEGQGPQQPVQGRIENAEQLRFSNNIRGRSDEP